MSAAQVHASVAGAALGANGHNKFKPAHAKASLNNGVLVIVVKDDIAKHFNGSVSARFNGEIYPGKLVIELRDDPKGNALSPLIPGQYRAQIPASKVPGCGTTFPSFGMIASDATTLGTDRVLRMVLPGKRPPVVKKPRVKMAPSRSKPEVKPVKEPEVKKQEEKPKVAPVAVPNAEDANEIRMRKRDTLVAHSKSRVEVRVGRELAKYVEGHRYGISQISDSGEEIQITLAIGAGYTSLGTTLYGPKKDFRAMTFPRANIDAKDVRFFGLTTAAEVLVKEEGKTIVVTLRGKLNELGHWSKTGGQKKAMAAPPATLPATNVSAPAPVEPAAIGESPLVLLKKRRDGVNECVRQINESGEKVELFIRDDGSLGFRYEG